MRYEHAAAHVLVLNCDGENREGMTNAAHAFDIVQYKFLCAEGESTFLPSSITTSPLPTLSFFLFLSLIAKKCC